jgi:hypothetical protein
MDTATCLELLVCPFGARLAMSRSEADLTSMLPALGADELPWGCLT